MKRSFWKITLCLLLTNSSDFFLSLFSTWSDTASVKVGLTMKQSPLFLPTKLYNLLFLLLWPHLCHSLNVLSFLRGKSLIFNYPPRSPHTFLNPLVRDLVSTFVFKYSLPFTPILLSLPCIFWVLPSYFHYLAAWKMLVRAPRVEMITLAPSFNTHTHTSLHTYTLTVMVNFMCQLAWSMGVLRYLVKHYSGAICEGISGWD